jgi:energy-coupling factor transporter ATP-binding protein EcfA2
MEGRLKVKNLRFGDLDAANELFGSKRDQERKFLASYVSPPHLPDLDAERDRITFIVGPKGSGKTALLNYLRITDTARKKERSELILFRRSVDTGALEKIDLLPGNKMARLDQRGVNSTESFRALWAWFLHRRIFDIVEQSHPEELLRNDDHFKKWMKFVKRYRSGPAATRSWSDLFSPIELQEVQVSANAGAAILKAIGKVIPRRGASETLTDVAAEAGALLSRVSGGRKAFGLYLDEIELQRGERRVFERDCALVGDLVETILDFRKRYAKNIPNLMLRCALRTEVVRAIIPRNQELLKQMNDLSIWLTWNQRAEGFKHPLFDMLLGKMRASIGEEANRPDFWESTFPKRIAKIPFPKFVLNQTWYRPRDVVRLFQNIQRQAILRDSDASKFIESDVVGALSTYSTESWSEVEAELSAGFLVDEIRFLKRALVQFSPRFRIADLERRLKKTRHGKLDGTTFLANHDLMELTNTLFRVGVIGNRHKESTGQEVHAWFHRDNPNIDTRIGMSIHSALWPELRISTVRK